MTRVSRKSAILRVARDLFAERGYDAVSVRDVAEKSGASVSALYYHYATKGSLLEEILESQLDQALEDVKRVYASSATYREKLRNVILSNLEATSDAPADAKIFLHAHAAYSIPHVERYFGKREEYLDLVSRIIEEGMSAGEFARADSRLLALGVLGMCNWAADWFDPAGRLSAIDIASVFSQLVLSGVEAKALRLDPPMGQGLSLDP